MKKSLKNNWTNISIMKRFTPFSIYILSMILVIVSCRDKKEKELPILKAEIQIKKEKSDSLISILARQTNATLDTIIKSFEYSYQNTEYFVEAKNNLLLKNCRIYDVEKINSKYYIMLSNHHINAMIQVNDIQLAEIIKKKKQDNLSIVMRVEYYGTKPNFTEDVEYEDEYAYSSLDIEYDYIDTKKIFGGVMVDYIFTQ